MAHFINAADHEIYAAFVTNNKDSWLKERNIIAIQEKNQID